MTNGRRQYCNKLPAVTNKLNAATSMTIVDRSAAWQWQGSLPTERFVSLRLAACGEIMRSFLGGLFQMGI